MIDPQDYEKLGLFYLGRPYDLERGELREGLYLYDSRDLVTHALCVGMTGSGKTGLCVSLLEEAAIDGVPAIVIDPKGDIANLMLTFPQLRPEDFRPWINEDDARRAGVDADVYAAQQAERWRKGLADWGQGPERIERLREAAVVSVYTPGSSAGLQVSVLRSFNAPDETTREDTETFRDRVATTAASLLGLAGIDADPVQSREHILLSTILSNAWAEGRDLDLAALIQMVQEPPFDRVGVLEVESFYPARDRFGLAIALNNLVASPGFAAWTAGEELDVQRFLYSQHGKPCVSIFSIGHLNDAERMFFVSLLLNHVLAWTRAQSGTSSLRAVVYMDEIYGYLPPVAAPPSKRPLLTLLKQARAFGVGVVLATQNPVDLDYKAISNIGTWFIGRLQTERDVARLLEGLEGAAAAAGHGFDRQRVEAMLAGLGNRVFFVNNAHEDGPEVFQSRWALSYLRGPLQRNQITQLVEGRRAAEPDQAKAASSRPVLQPGITEYIMPLEAGAGPHIVYSPVLYVAAAVQFSNAKLRIDEVRDVHLTVPIEDAPVPVDWNRAALIEVTPGQLGNDPSPNAAFAALPKAAARVASYKKWAGEAVAWLAATQAVSAWRSPGLGELSIAGESEAAFRARLQHVARERRDQAVVQLERKYAPKVQALRDRLRRAEQAVQREQEQVSASRWDTALNVGSTLLGSVFGRRSLITGATSTARSVRRGMRESSDVKRAAENVEAISGQLQELDRRFREEVAGIERRLDPATEVLEEVVVRPARKGVSIRLVALAWRGEHSSSGLAR
jgi:hypothetical protein